MTKEYTGPEFRLEFKRADYEWEKGGRVGPDPRTQWQCLSYSIKNVVEDGNGSVPIFVADVRYRWKPKQKRMVRIGYRPRVTGELIEKWVVAPETEAPPLSSKFFVLAHSHDNYWEGTRVDFENLNNGCVFLTLEDRDAMADWLAVCRKGGQS